MSARARVARTRTALGAVLAARALLWGLAAAALVALALAGARAAGALPSSSPPWPVPLAPLLAGAATMVALLVRPLRALRPADVALWIEARTPGLDYALVTLSEGAVSAPFADALERRVAAARWGRALARRAARALAAPLLLLLAAAGLHAAMPDGIAARRGTAPRTGSAPAAGDARGEARSALAPLRVTVSPPAYAGRRARELRDPASVAELVGGSLVVRGPTAGAALRVRVGATALRVQPDGDGWRVALTMPARPTVLTLVEGPRTRLVVLEPRADSAPVVQLVAPARDSVFRVPSGRVPLAAGATDDVGLVRGGFEYIVSSGSGESFTFRSGRLADRALGRAASARLETVLDLTALQLKAGDVLHVRAVATDANTVSGPSLGTSETRTLRIARAGEYDSLAVEAAAPPAADKSLVSQRMLIMLTEALERRRPRLAREQLVRESRTIASDQAKLRKAVSDIVFTRLGSEPTGEHSHFEGDGHEHASGSVSGPLTPEELVAAADRATGGGATALDSHGDETPILAVNKPLLEAYNAMWDASRELEAAEPRRALPPMRRALAAIQRARQAERVYLRGRPPAVVVDIARVRLQGTDRGASNPRQPREPADDPASRLGARLTRAVELLVTEPGAAVDSLTLLRVDALADAPPLAAALGEAIEAIRGGRDATAALVRARRVAGLVPSAPEPLGAWGRR